MIMALFTKRDRIAIAVLGALIFTGWGTRLFLNRPKYAEDIQLIHGAVTPPPDTTDSEPLSFTPGNRRIDLNRASAEELETLPMIGPAKAAAIIQWRGQNGKFAQPEDIMKVKGIGPKIFERIKPYVTVE